jgi:hypothetical protein
MNATTPQPTQSSIDWIVGLGRVSVSGRRYIVPIVAVVLVSAVLLAVVGVAVYLISGGVSRRVAWQEQARVIFWDGERPEGQEPDR